MTRLSSLALAVGLLTTPAAIAAPTPAVLDPAGSWVKFKAYTKVMDADGKFGDFKVSGTFDPEDFAKSQFTLTVAPKSIDTDNGMRDNHLRSDDFFDVEKYPQATFVTTAIAPAKKPGWYTITGKLTIKQKVSTVSIPVEVKTEQNKQGKTVTHVHGVFVLNRFDVGIDWPGSLVMPDIDKKIDMDVQMSLVHP